MISQVSQPHCRLTCSLLPFSSSLPSRKLGSGMHCCVPLPMSLQLTASVTQAESAAECSPADPASLAHFFCRLNPCLFWSESYTGIQVLLQYRCPVRLTSPPYLPQSVLTKRELCLCLVLSVCGREQILLWCVLQSASDQLQKTLCCWLQQVLQ